MICLHIFSKSPYHEVLQLCPSYACCFFPLSLFFHFALSDSLKNVQDSRIAQTESVVRSDGLRPMEIHSLRHTPPCTG